MKKTLRPATLLLSVLLVLFNASHGGAQDAPKFVGSDKPVIAISPFLHDVRFASNEATKEFSVNITNSSSSQRSLTLTVLDFGSLNESGGVVFAGTKASNLTTKYGLANWLQLSSSSLSLNSGQTTVVTATIINDVSMQPGGHYAAIVASVDGEGDSQTSKITINQKLSSLILATKLGGEKYDLKLEDINTSSSKLRWPKTATLRFSNPGNVHVVPRGTVKLVTSGGKLVAKGVINEDSSFVLPSTTRKISVNLNRVSSAGLLPTLYHLEVDYRYDGIDKFAHKEKLVYYTNLPNLATLSLIIIMFLWLSWRFRSRLKRFCRELKTTIEKLRNL